jgi:Putative rhamnosyl transferase
MHDLKRHESPCDLRAHAHAYRVRLANKYPALVVVFICESISLPELGFQITAMQHLILTKLAVGNPTPEWLVHRLDIFKHYCAPSVLLQTYKNFRWLLAVNPATPRWFLEAAGVAAANAEFVYHTEPTLTPRWTSLIRPFVNRGPLITTRLDSDDMVQRRFVEVVQAHSEYSPYDEVIDFPIGLRVNLPDFAYVTLMEKRPTHFISLIERSDVHKTVCSFSHKRADRNYPIRTASLQPFWAELCHGQNIVNALRPNDAMGYLDRAMLMRLMLQQ